MRSSWTAGAGLALLTVVLTGPALVGRASLAEDAGLDWDPLYRTAPAARPTAPDNTPSVLDLPRDLEVARGFRAGRLAAWTSLSGCGVPLWAEQGGPFFPLKLAFYLAPSRRGYDAYLALRLFVAALGACALARRRGLAPAPAFAAAAAYELSGTMVHLLPFGVASPVFMLPWLLLGAEALASRPSPLAVVGTALAIGVALHGGHPTLALLALLAFAVAIAAHVGAAWARPRRAAVVGVSAALAVGLGLALAAPTLLPLAELVQLSSTYKTRGAGALARAMDLAASRASWVAALTASGASGSARQLLSPALGTLVLALAFVGALGGRRRRAMLAVAIVGFVLAVVPWPVGALLDVTGFRFVLPGYAWSLVVVAATQLVGDGFACVARERRWRAVLGGVGCYAGIALWRVGVASLPALAPVALAALVLIAIVILRGSRLGRLAAPLLLVLVVGDGVLTSGRFALHPPAKVLTAPATPAVRFLREALRDGQGRLNAVPFPVGHPLTPMMFGLADVRGVAALPLRRYYDYLHAISPAAGELTVFGAPVSVSPLLDLAAVGYLVLPAPELVAAEDRAGQLLLAVPAVVHPDEAPVYQDGTVRVYRNAGALARVRLVHRVIRVPGEDAARRWARGVGGRRVHAREAGLADTVVLEPAAPGRVAPEPSGTASPDDAVRIVDDSHGDELTLRVRAAGSAFVVIADAYYPGWKAWVDGVPAAIYPANLLFRAVHVPAGEHTVVLRYEPVWLRVGLLLAAIAAAGCMVALVRGRPRAATRVS